MSALLTSGTPASVVDLVADGKIITFYSNLILQEYQEVLSRKKFGFSTLQVARLIDNIVNTGFALEDKPPVKNRKVDEGDRMFYDAAVDSQSYLVTGNMRHFPAELFIVTPAQFLAIYNNTVNSFI